MTVLDYTLQIPLPAPLAAGAAIQSYTDPSGDVWVAKGGVNNGNWYRARDVVHARWYKNAAQNTVNGVVAVSLDTADRDPYGLWNTGSSAFYAPVAGLYLGHAQITVTPTAAAQAFTTRIYQAGTYRTVSQYVSGSTVGLSMPSTLLWYLAAGDYMQPTVTASGAFTIVTASFWTFMSFDYLGTG